MMKIAKNRFQRLVQKKCGVCFDGAYATKKLVPRVYIALLLSCLRWLFKLRGIPLCAEKPANGDGLKEADPEEGHPRGGVEVHELEEEDSAFCAHGQAQGEQQAAHAHCACVEDALTSSLS
jgi:hypothetical protein